MAKIKIYSDVKTDIVFFEGARTVSNKKIGTLEAVAHPTESDRVIIKSTTVFKNSSDTEHKVFFKRLKINRIENEEGEQLIAAPYLYNREQVLNYLNDQFKKPTILEYFEYNPETDRLRAKKAIETTLSSIYLGDQHRLSSGAANIYFDNLTTNESYYPVLGGLKDQSDTANQAPGQGLINPYARIFQDYGVSELGGTPVNNTAIAYDGDNFFPFNIAGVGITTRVAEIVPPTQRLKYELSVDGTKVYEQYLDHSGLSVNEDLTWYFNHPLDVEAGSTNHASITKVETINNQEVEQGLLLVCEGNDGTGRYQTNVLRRFFDDKKIALKDEIENLEISDINGIDFSTPPSVNQILKYNGENFVPSNESVGSVELINKTVNITENSWGKDTNYIYNNIPVQGVNHGQLCIIYPNPSLWETIQSNNCTWNGYAYCNSNGFVNAVCRVSTGITLPSFSSFSIKIIESIVNIGNLVVQPERQEIDILNNNFVVEPNDYDKEFNIKSPLDYNIVLPALENVSENAVYKFKNLYDSTVKGSFVPLFGELIEGGSSFDFFGRGNISIRKKTSVTESYWSIVDVSNLFDHVGQGKSKEVSFDNNNGTLEIIHNRGYRPMVKVYLEDGLGGHSDIDVDIDHNENLNSFIVNLEGVTSGLVRYI